MRRTSTNTELEVALESADEAHHRAARADTPAAHVVLPPHAVPVAKVPPTSSAGTALRFPRRVPRWISAHGQLVMIAVLVVVASIATALVATQGVRQLDLGPREGTTPYLAVEPRAPVHVPPGVSRGPHTAQPPPVESDDGAGTPARPPGAERRQSPGTPESAAPPKLPGVPPEGRSPEVGEPPTTEPPATEPPRSEPPTTRPPTMPVPPPRWCDVMKQHFGRCVVRMPRPPTPSIPGRPGAGDVAAQ